MKEKVQFKKKRKIMFFVSFFFVFKSFEKLLNQNIQTRITATPGVH